MSEPKEWMISPADEANDEIVCDVGYEKNFPDRLFTRVIEKSAYASLALRASRLHEEVLDGAEKEYLLEKKIEELRAIVKEQLGLSCEVDQLRAEVSRLREIEAMYKGLCK